MQNLEFDQVSESSHDEPIPENEEYQSKSKGRPQDSKKRMPESFYKAKKTLTKLVTEFFNELRNEFLRIGGDIYLNRDHLPFVKSAINAFVSLRKLRVFGLNFNSNTEEKPKSKNPRLGIFTYISESQKILNYTKDCTLNVITLKSDPQLKLPDLATPVPLDDQIYLLDGNSFNQQKNIFLPNQCAFKITSENCVSQLPYKPKYPRMKCCILKDHSSIYLLGGLVTEFKLKTKTCQKFNCKTQKFQDFPSLNLKHNCPSGCFLNSQMYLFSPDAIEIYADSKWTLIQKPFASNFRPFQFVHAINEKEIILFGGMTLNQKSSEVQVYNTESHSIQNFGNILPQPLCKQRSWGPCLIKQHLAVFSSIQASVYPHVGIKSNMSQIVLIGTSGSFLNSILHV